VRILHVDPDDIDNPLSGGGPRRTFEICRRLARRHEVTVLTPTFPGSTPTLEREGVRYVRLGRKLGDHGSSHHITFFFAMAGAVRRHPHDLLVQDFMPPAGSTHLPLIDRGPLVASVQWFSADLLSRQYGLPFGFGQRSALRLYRRFVVLTEDMRNTIVARHRNARCEVIANAAADGLFELPLCAGQGVLYLGRLEYQLKGLDLLLDAYHRMPAHARPPLTIAGAGNDEAQVRAHVERLGLSADVRFVGPVDEAGRARLLQACRFVCMPSRHETFGMVALEASAAGKPVIVFDQGPMREVTPASLAPVAPFDVGAYAREMARWSLADDAALLAQGAASRAFARDRSWDRSAALQERFYEDTVATWGRRTVQ
jgi:glycosyltransferase involved in cell wall biosynthesis